MTFLFAASLFFTGPIVSDLPRADAYLVEDDTGAPHLEDRYSIFDLWSAQRVAGCWADDEGRTFTLAVLDRSLPALLDEPSETRVEFEENAVPLARDDERELFRAVQALVPVPIALPDDWVKPHQLPRTCREVFYCEGTNEHLIVAAFLPEKSSRWLLAVRQLAEEDDLEAERALFEDRFLHARAWVDKVPPEPSARGGKRKAPWTERELLRRDLVHSVTNYPAWRVTASTDLMVLDELGGHADFIARLTNELVRIRGAYAKTVPSPVDGSNTLAVARLYAGREAYLKAAGPDMAWSAAYWCQPRREIVAYLPEDGEDELLRTLRHEGFHQYLAYAGAMILSAPWINEGYAEFFEGDENGDERRCRALQALAVAQPRNLKAMLVNLLAMDYPAFYDDDAKIRATNYLLAWSVAYFLEVGAPEVRFEPFKNLTRDYMVALLKTHDRARATEAVFGEETLELFLSEWLKFWKEQ